MVVRWQSLHRQYHGDKYGYGVLKRRHGSILLRHTAMSSSYSSTSYNKTAANFTRHATTTKTSPQSANTATTKELPAVTLADKSPIKLRQRLHQQRVHECQVRKINEQSLRRCHNVIVSLLHPIFNDILPSFNASTTCFENTVLHLVRLIDKKQGHTTTTLISKSNNNVTANLARYQKFYLDSIPSFTVMLQDGISMEHQLKQQQQLQQVDGYINQKEGGRNEKGQQMMNSKSSQETRSNNININHRHSILNKTIHFLEKEGLHDLQLIRQYRQTKLHLKLRHDCTDKIQTGQKEYDAILKNIQKLEYSKKIQLLHLQNLNKNDKLRLNEDKLEQQQQQHLQTDNKDSETTMASTALTYATDVMQRFRNLFSPSDTSNSNSSNNTEQLQQHELEKDNENEDLVKTSQFIVNSDIEEEIKEELSLSSSASSSSSTSSSSLLQDLTKSVDNYKLRLSSLEKSMKKVKSFEQNSTYTYQCLQDDKFIHLHTLVQNALDEVLCPALAMHIMERHSDMIDHFILLDAHTDLTKPHEWYPYARLDRRKIIFHGGPTNSGKTYQALQRLKTAQKGLYVGPLRLLAAEVYETLTSAGVYTNLLTGQDSRDVPFATHTAATVELTPLDEEFDIVVIDEIQMIADTFRGHAWTQALLGVRCKEIHVCGGLEAQSLLEKIVKRCGDDFELRTYKRFTESEISSTSLARKGSHRGSYSKVQPGDCVVAFSRNDIFAIKREIEKSSTHKCCVIYGSLPPEVRTDQARRFNNPNSGYDVLVASDAIGMGMNLNIKRLILHSIYKADGETIVRLSHSAVKQICGRAGRHNSKYPIGEVTCRDPADLNYVRSCLSRDVRQITNAGLHPTISHIEMFCDGLQRFNANETCANLYLVMEKFNDMAKLQGDYFLCRKASTKTVSKWLDSTFLPIGEKYIICMSPVRHREAESMMVLQKFVAMYAAGKVPGLHLKKYPKKPESFRDLDGLCIIYNKLELFNWLNRRFAGNIVEQQTAEMLVERTTKLINEALSVSETLQLSHCYIERDTRLRMLWKNAQMNENRRATED